MLIIGFGSKAQNGKDTAAEAIRDFYESRNQLLLKHDHKDRLIKVGIFKFATALYKEVDNFLLTTAGEGWLRNMQGSLQGFNYDTITIPNWVLPDPNPEINILAPHGKHPKLLQWWGTEYRRKNFGQNYWVDKLFTSIPLNTDIALISDVRFLNEANAITSHGGYCINVQRLNKDGTQYFATDRPVDHPSETQLDSYNWDFKLVNSAGHQALLAEQAITLCEYLRGLSD